MKINLNQKDTDKIFYKAKNLLGLFCGILFGVIVGGVFQSMGFPVLFSFLIAAFISIGQVILYFKFHQSNILASCLSAVSASITSACPIPNVNGVNATFYIANLADIASYTESAGIVSVITRVSGKFFYTWDGVKNSNNAKQTIKTLKYSTSFIHEVSGLFIGVNAAGKQQLEKLANGKVVVIVRNNFTGTSGDAKYEIYGLVQGLVLTDLTRDQSVADNLGVYNYTLKSDDAYPESKLPFEFYHTNEATTDSDVVAFLT